MSRITYGINSLYKTASFHFETGPFWAFWLSDALDFVCGYLIPRFPLPPIPIPLLSKSAVEFNNGKRWTNMKEWWGTPDGWFCGCIHIPLADMCYRHMKHEFVKADYDELKAAMGKYDKIFEEQEKDLDESPL